MVGRARSKETAHYPAFLLRMSHRGELRFRFTTVESVKRLFPSGTTEQEAIQAAYVDNMQNRPELTQDFDLNELTQFQRAISKGRRDKFNKPLKDWLSVVLARVKAERNSRKTYFET